MMERLHSPVLILGARSDIGRALARAYAARGCDLILAARNAKRLQADCKDLAIRFGIKAQLVEFNVNGHDHDAFLAELGEVPGTVIMVVGLLGDQDESFARDIAASLVFTTNFIGPARMLLAAARLMRDRPGSAIIGISSVAGDRGRGSNFIYGSAKAGFSAFLSGLRNALAPGNVKVITVKPGFVDTQMTAGMNLPPLLTASVYEVADAVIKAHERGKAVIYVRPIWRVIMLIIRSIPETVFKRLKL